MWCLPKDYFTYKAYFVKGMMKWGGVKYIKKLMTSFMNDPISILGKMSRAYHKITLKEKIKQKKISQESTFILYL